MKKLNIILTLMILLITGISMSQTGIIINADAKLGISGDAYIKISEGDFINHSDLNQFNGTITFLGTSDQSISGSVESEFSVLEVNNSSLLNLGNNIRINDELYLIQGLIDILENDLIFSDNSVISGTFSSDNMINADGSGFVIREISNSDIYFFPVGDMTSGADYSPVELDFQTGMYNNANISLNLSDSKHPNNTSSTNFISRYWTLNSSGISAFICDVDFTYVNDDITGNEAEIFGALWNGSDWIQLDYASGLQFTGTIDEFGDFTGAESDMFNDIFYLNGDLFTLTYTDGIIFIHSAGNIKISHAEVYNSIGQLLNVYDLSDTELNEIHYSGSPGYYLIKIFTEDSYITKKIIIN